MSKSAEIIFSVAEFFSMMSGGFFIALLFDVFRSMRKAVRKNNGRNLIGFVYLQDLLFLLMAFVFFVLLIYRVNGGKLDWYISLGCIVGAVVYYYLAEPIAGKLIFFIFFVVVRFFKIIMSATTKIFGGIKKLLKITKNDKKITKKHKKTIKKAGVTQIHII